MTARIALWITALLIAAVAGAAAFVWSGLCDISATRQHTQFVYSLLEKTMHESVKLRAERVTVPPLDGAATLQRGAACYVQKCAQCHGGPGFTQGEIGRSMQPLPGPLADATRKWTPAELYWIVRNGIKMSGMPAWQHRITDEDQWAVVAFMQRLPALTAADFRATVAAAQTGPQCVAPTPDAALVSAASPATSPPALGDAERGRAATTQYACNACHRIPGVTGSDVSVGPPLAGFASRRLIAGAVPNDARQLVRWIRDPQSIDPETTMPNMQVAERDARDIAAYLLSLH